MNQCFDHLGMRTVQWTPQGEEDIAAVEAQLERIIASPLFALSKRYPHLLQYVVQESLQGRADAIKERTLGVEVFSRLPDYDTESDHVVRNTACEVRKRLKLYYQQPGSENEIIIQLPVGTYAPTFLRPNASTLDPQLRNGNRTANTLWGLARLRLRAQSGSTWMILALVMGFGIGEITARTPVRTSLPSSIGLKAGLRRSGVSSTARQALVQVLKPKPGQHLYVVVGDPIALLLFEEHKLLRVEDYTNSRLADSSESLLDLSPNSAKLVNLLENHINWFDSFPLLNQVINTLPASEVSLKHPASVTEQDFESNDNVLLIGGPRANPWVQLFENRLAFRTDLTSDTHSILDVAPLPGEQRAYTYNSTSDVGYARIAYIPNLAYRGKLMLVSGPCPACTSAAITFATNPAVVPRVLRMFGVNHLSDLRSFELLLQVRAEGSTPIQTRIVAGRKD